MSSSMDYLPARAGNESTRREPAATVPCLGDVPLADLIRNPELLQGAPCIAVCADAETLLPCGVRPLEHQRRYTHLDGVARVKETRYHASIPRYHRNNANHHTCRRQSKFRHGSIGMAYLVERERRREGAITSSHNDDISLRQFLWCARHRGWCSTLNEDGHLGLRYHLARAVRVRIRDVWFVSDRTSCSRWSPLAMEVAWAYMKSVTVTSKA